MKNYYLIAMALAFTGVVYGGRTNVSFFNYSNEPIFVASYEPKGNQLKRIQLEKGGGCVFFCTGDFWEISKGKEGAYRFGKLGSSAKKIFIVLSAKKNNLNKTMAVDKLQPMLHREVMVPGGDEDSRQQYYYLLKIGGTLKLINSSEIGTLDEKYQDEIRKKDKKRNEPGTVSKILDKGDIFLHAR